MNTDISTYPREQSVVIYFRRDQAIYFYAYGRPPEDKYVLPFLERNSANWIHITECLQSPWRKVSGMWCIYIILQLKQGTYLNTAIYQELYETGEDLYQNDRDIEIWFSYKYARVILSHNGMRRLTFPDFLFKHRIQRLVNAVIIHIKFQGSILCITCCKYVKEFYCK